MDGDAWPFSTWEMKLGEKPADRPACGARCRPLRAGVSPQDRFAVRRYRRFPHLAFGIMGAHTPPKGTLAESSAFRPRRSVPVGSMHAASALKRSRRTPRHPVFAAPWRVTSCATPAWPSVPRGASCAAPSSDDATTTRLSASSSIVVAMRSTILRIILPLGRRGDLSTKIRIVMIRGANDERR